MKGEHLPGLFRGMSPIARTGDPSTSRDSARVMSDSGVRGMMMKKAMDLLKSHPGSTSNELDCLGGHPNGGIRKRLADLEKIGVATKRGIRVCKISGRRCHTWEATA